MNFVLLDPRELTADGIYALSGARATHLIQIVKVVPGTTVRTVELGVGRGRGEVMEVVAGGVLIRPLRACERDVTPPLSGTLVVALCRPQSVKKVLELAGAVGVARLRFINADRVERSFFASSVLERTSIERHLQLGMEQGGISVFPEVETLEWFRPGVLSFRGGAAGARCRDYFDELRGARCRTLLLHPPITPDAGEAVPPVPPDHEWCAVIGPEGGWTEREVEAWLGVGCSAYSLGHQIVRVETAVTMLVAQLALMRRLSLGEPTAESYTAAREADRSPEGSGTARGLTMTGAFL